ncbi:receptor-like serine/threonine-protein kinase [Populus alba x Populus x berolinensis]|uniref:Receptor-like serine/threonine-protein kinase n=1 Tax=Populus alba x Populus x berolinensis TaxID=444605 RepID=A0AAD6QWN8_9ROSI|nr:receptor-like serine/threonine-protein kinase [Populus alba x Populus x berolinensis]KAJ6998083.1 receptor-like serine/threonine-protein kinase [Populus alba x Populus x berolinensis]KAJ6998084.1 receptor-like serine/threonine-protein kinase [Populus alba x Populus x berolinensis]
MRMLLREGEGMADSGDSTVIVGVKLDPASRELLTWALVKVAQPGDTVIALHILDNNEIVDREGKSTLLSLVKAFDNVLAVYEGFCNLKQVDLKLKLCRGSSFRRILVREAKSYTATKVIVGATKNHLSIWPSTSVAKYCAKKLPKDCSVLAFNNGKVVFQRERTPKNTGTKDHVQSGLLGVVHKTISFEKNSRVSNEGGTNEASRNDQDNGLTLEQVLMKARSNSLASIMRENCSVCGSVMKPADDSCNKSAEASCGDSDGDDKSLALVPVPRVEEPTSSVSTLISQVPELKPGWPLLRSSVLPNRKTSDRSFVRQISVVQWAMRLPSRQLSLSTVNSDHKQDVSDKGEAQLNLDGESGAIVAVGMETATAPLSPDHNSRSLPKELEGLHEKYSATCRLFQGQELLSATSNFLAENLIGKGGSSQVYKGCLPDGKELAVKILKPSEDVLKEFVQEIEIITTLSHKNIISLLGFCFEEKNLLLVYDFLSRGSLEENLHGNKKDPHAFGWNERYKVALGIAEALDYLHSCSAQPVIHRDVKSSNILLSDDFEPQLSDFGLAKWAPTSSSHIICNDVAGTFGYLAPEYFMYGKVNNKIDVYAFGVVLLELLSGKKPISNDLPKGQESLVMWAKPILNGGKVSQLLDPILGDSCDRDQMERMVLAATLCVRRAPRARPQMSLVVKLLQGDAEVTRWARLQVNAVEESDVLDDEACPRSNLQSHLNLALLDVENDSLSSSSLEQSISLQDYLQGRWSRSSSLD